MSSRQSLGKHSPDQFTADALIVEPQEIVGSQEPRPRSRHLQPPRRNRAEYVLQVTGAQHRNPGAIRGRQYETIWGNPELGPAPA